MYACKNLFALGIVKLYIFGSQVNSINKQEAPVAAVAQHVANIGAKIHAGLHVVHQEVDFEDPFYLLKVQKRVGQLELLPYTDEIIGLGLNSRKKKRIQIPIHASEARWQGKFTFELLP